MSLRGGFAMRKYGVVYVNIRTYTSWNSRTLYPENIVESVHSPYLKKWQTILLIIFRKILTRTVEPAIWDYHLNTASRAELLWKFEELYKYCQIRIWGLQHSSLAPAAKYKLLVQQGFNGSVAITAINWVHGIVKL